MNFTEKYGPWALITGASEGTGSAFARQLAEAGLNLILIARRQGPLDALATEIASIGVECVTASVDLAAEDASERIAEAVGQREIGLLIANAGADTNGSAFLDTDIANWDKLVRLNVLTTMRNCHRFGRAMRERRRGGIILVGSGACYGGLNGIAVYSAAKGFLLNFGEALWAELRHSDVNVLNLVMSRTDTPAHRELMERNGQSIPEGMASAEDVAALGLARLPFGPVVNWGEADDEIGMSPNSPAQRRARILAIEEVSRAYTGAAA